MPCCCRGRKAPSALKKLDADGVLDLGTVSVERRGKAAVRDIEEPALPQRRGRQHARRHGDRRRSRDPRSQRPTSPCCAAALVEHPKYAGRRLFGAGINLTHLYRGQIPFVWFLKRDLGFVHKFFRGVAQPDALPDDVHGTGIEKPWIAAVDGFAIGGHCQILLTMDYVLAASDAFMTLPARKEGIIPGAANLRLPRFTGDRITRQSIQYERKLRLRQPGRPADLRRDRRARPRWTARSTAWSPRLTSSGAVSATSNRRAIRIGEEPLDLSADIFRLTPATRPIATTARR